MNTMKTHNHTFADNFINNVSDVGNAVMMDFIYRHGIGDERSEGIPVSVEDKESDDGVARHFYYNDKRIFTLYYGKQGVIIFKPKW